MKTLSEQIKEMQDKIVALRDLLLAATKALEEAGDNQDALAAAEGAVVERTAELETATARLETLQKAEKALGTQATTAQPAAAVIKHLSKSKDTDLLLGKLALSIFESRVKSMSPQQVAIARFGDNEALQTVIKAAQNPAMSNVAGYAQELTQMIYGTFMDLLREESLMARATPLTQQHQFNGASSIFIPMRTGGIEDASATFRAEGGPIPVKGLQFTSQALTPKNMGVILSATEEMLTRSSIDLASYFQMAMVQDTGSYLDGEFISATAGSVIRPAGIRNAIPGGDTRAASGSGTTADIVADLKAMLTAMAEAHMGGSNTRWLMSPKNWFTVSMALTATGSLQFPETANGRLANIPAIVTTNMPDNVVLLVDFTHITTAIGSPQFLASQQAVIHEESVNPVAIGTAGTPNVVAAPARSLFQTNSWALRLMLDVDWAKLRSSGLVQELTAVAWVG
jgi:HK97 family phage major capsid protein